jgi:hypothetical protein
MTATYSDGTPIQVGDIVRRGRGRVDYRVADILPYGDQACVHLKPLTGYGSASAIGAEAIAALVLVEEARPTTDLGLDLPLTLEGTDR